MHWKNPEEEVPRMHERVLVETVDGQLCVALYRPEYYLSWVIDFCHDDNGSMISFHAQIYDVKRWASIGCQPDE